MRLSRTPANHLAKYQILEAAGSCSVSSLGISARHRPSGIDCFINKIELQKKQVHGSADFPNLRTTTTSTNFISAFTGGKVPLQNNLATRPHLNAVKQPHTLAKALHVVEHKYESLSQHSRSMKGRLSAFRNTCKHLSTMLGPAECIYLDDLVEIDRCLVPWLEGRGLVHQSAVQHCCNLRKLLDEAHKLLNWTSDAYELRKSWQPVREALKKKAPGCAGIVRFAIRHGRTPATFNRDIMDEWKKSKLARGYSLGTVVNTESLLRKTARRAGLQKLFSEFSLECKNPPKYRMNLKDLTDSLRAEISSVIRWKMVKRNLKDRPARLVIRDVTARSLLKYLLQLCGYAIQEKRHTGINSLSALLTEEIVCGYIDWLRERNPNRGRAGITATLSSIHCLTQTYPPLKAGNYGWFREKLDTLPKEKRARKQQRKLNRLPEYRPISQIPTKLLELCDPKSLTPVKIAWLYHDALLFLTSLTIPHRSRNISEAGINPDIRLNIYETPIDSELVSQFQLPAWAAEARKREPRRKFLVVHWLEEHVKANVELWRVFPDEVTPLFREYSNRRHLIVGIPDPGTLFLSRKGAALTQKTLLALVARLSVRYCESIRESGKHMTTKLFRDLVAAHLLDSGSTLEEVQDRLQQLDPNTTSLNYIGGFNTSDAVLQLEDDLAALAE
jgi:hypothetical protein